MIDETGKVLYSKIIPELKDEPDYQEVLAVLQQAGADPLEVCTHTGTAEHSRPEDMGEPCDDGRAG